MDNLQLMKGEEILTETTDKTITLTNYRIRLYEKRYGKANLTSIHLDKVSSIEMKFKSNLILLYLGILIIISGVAYGASIERPEAMALGGGLGILFILIYLFTRHHVISIASDGGAKINFLTKGMKNEAHINFINKVESAKQDLRTKN